MFYNADLLAAAFVALGLTPQDLGDYPYVVDVTVDVTDAAHLCVHVTDITGHTRYYADAEVAVYDEILAAISGAAVDQMSENVFDVKVYAHDELLEHCDEASRERLMEKLSPDAEVVTISALMDDDTLYAVATDERGDFCCSFLIDAALKSLWKWLLADFEIDSFDPEPLKKHDSCSSLCSCGSTEKGKQKEVRVEAKIRAQIAREEAEELYINRYGCLPY